MTDNRRGGQRNLNEVKGCTFINKKVFNAQHEILGALSVVAPVHDNVNFNDFISSYNEGRYFIKFDFATVPAWAGITAGYNEAVVTRQGETNWFFEIKESESMQYRLRIIYSRQSSTIKIAYKIPATKLTTT